MYVDGAITRSSVVEIFGPPVFPLLQYPFSRLSSSSSMEYHAVRRAGSSRSEYPAQRHTVRDGTLHKYQQPNE